MAKNKIKWFVKVTKRPGHSSFPFETNYSAYLNLTTIKWVVKVTRGPGVSLPILLKLITRLI